MKKLLFILPVAVLIVLLLSPYLSTDIHYVATTYEKIANPPIRMLFVGDMMFDRNVAVHARKYGKDTLFAGILPLFEGNDLNIGNLEGTITANKSIAQYDHSILRFTFDPSYAELLKGLKFSALSLANNHSLDFYGDGYFETIQNLSRLGIGTFGSPRNDILLSVTREVKGKKICLVGYHDLYIADSASTNKEVVSLRPQCSFLVVFAHWGNEYEDVPSERQMTLAHEFIDNGADLVIGSHPHVVQSLEVYKNKAIFYSLGNFMFDQYFSFETQHGLAVVVEWDEKETIFNIVPVSLEKSEAKYADAEDGTRIVEALVNNYSLPEEVKGGIVEKKLFTLK